MIGEALKASPGDNILRKYRQLADAVEALRLISMDDRIEVNQTPNGQHLTLLDAPASVFTPLQVRSAGQDLYSVGAGTINSRIPTIITRTGKEVPIVDADGVPHPPAPLGKERPIVVAAEVVFKGDLSLERVRIVTKQPSEIRQTGTANYVATGAGQITGHIPLAFLRRGTFFQFVLHNLQARAYLQGAAPRVLYWPA